MPPQLAEIIGRLPIGPDLPRAEWWTAVVILFAFGAAIGSFLNVVVYRVPLGLSIVYPGSRCTTCGRPIRWYDNVPIVSWLLLRGRCRSCRATISIRYPAVEAATAALFVGLGAAGPLAGRPESMLPFGALALWYVWTYRAIAVCAVLAATGVLVSASPRRVRSGPLWVFAAAVLLVAVMEWVLANGVIGLCS